VSSTPLTGAFRVDIVHAVDHGQEFDSIDLETPNPQE
jgi:hypothetical protein